MTPILSIKNLSKDFSSVKALSDVTFDIERGKIVGLLGPNGAGKTTLLRIINSILVADSGSVTINGQPASFDTSKYLGYMPEERGLYDKMKVADQILYFGTLKGGKRQRMLEVMHEYLTLFNLNGQERRQVRELSKGNQQKVQIIATLVHEPEFVILDEPFSGFDPINGAILQQLIHKLHSQGVTVMLSSHNIPAIEEMCENIILMNHGHMLVHDSITNLKQNHKDNSLLITTASPLDLNVVSDTALLNDIMPTPPQAWRKGYSYIMHKSADTRNIDILDMIAQQSEILHFEEKLPSLQEIFLKYTTK